MSDEWPNTPRQLLEKRYQCFTKGEVDFILQSHHPETRDQVERSAVENWSKNSVWKGMEVHEEQAEGDDHYFIRFTVTYRRENETTPHMELAEFRKHEGRWYYYDSEFPNPETIRRDRPKLGRNDPCHCGSGRKFKKCHGAAA